MQPLPQVLALLRLDLAAAATAAVVAVAAAKQWLRFCCGSYLFSFVCLLCLTERGQTVGAFVLGVYRHLSALERDFSFEVSNLILFKKFSWCLAK